MTRVAASLIGKRNDEDQAFRPDDFAKDPLTPHHAAIRRLHAVVEHTTRSEIDIARAHRETLRAPPVIRRSRSVQDLNTRSHGASKIRVMRNWNSPFVDLFS